MSKTFEARADPVTQSDSRSLRQFGSYSIRFKLLVAAFAATAIAVTFITFFAGRTTKELLTDSAGRELELVASSHALAVGELLARQTTSLELLSHNQALQSKVRSANETLSAQAPEMPDAPSADGSTAAVMELAAFQRAFPAHVDVLVTDRFGGVQASTFRPSADLQAGEDWWQAAYNGGQGAIYVGSPSRDRERGFLAIDIAVPMVDPQSSQAIGVIRSIYDATDLLVLLASSDSDRHTSRLELLFPSNEKLTVREARIDPVSPAFQAFVQRLENEAWSEVIIADIPSLVSQATVTTLGQMPSVDALGWQVITYRDRSESLALAGEQQRSLILIGVAVLLLTAGVSAVLARRLTAPITRLTEAAARAETGDLFARAPVESQDEIGALAKTFNNMTRRLQDTLLVLERRVADRTHALETSTEVSKTLSTILEQEQLVTQVVELVRSAFGYYHAHIYLVDESNGDLVMAGGTGEAGLVMLGRGHRIASGKGLVGRAAVTNKIVHVPNVAMDEGWLPNPLLPDTKAEIAAPITYGEQVLGVLDVQHNEVDGLTEEDARLLQSVSSQVAIALRNARLFEQVQQQAEREMTINTINQRIRAAQSIEDVLQIAARELNQTLRVRRTTVQLGPTGKRTNGDNTR